MILKEKTAVVTGASRGIGAAIAQGLASHGANVVINYKSAKTKAEEVLAAIEKDGGKAMIFGADVRNRQAVDAMIKAAVNAYGKVDILVNNANINFPMKPFMEYEWPEMEAKIMGEMQAMYNCCQAVLPGMTERKSGRIILISSTLSRQPGYGFCAHSAAKSAMDGMAKVMASELGPMGVTVNVLGPGLVSTDATADLPDEMRSRIAAMTPLRRVGEPDDLAGPTVFLASDLSGYVTGQYIPVNGGSFVV